MCRTRNYNAELYHAFVVVASIKFTSPGDYKSPRLTPENIKDT